MSIKRYRNVVSVGLLLLIAITMVLYAPVNIEAKTPEIDFTRSVKTITVEGLSELSEDVVSTNFEVQIGRKIDEVSLIQDINALYLTGFFSKVTALTRVTRNQIELIYNLKENPILTEIEMKGNTLFSEGKIRTLMRNKEGYVFNLKWVDEDKKRITAFYKEKGFDYFEVDEMSIEKQQKLTIALQEGRIRKIDFEGLEHIQPFILYRELSSKEGGIYNAKIFKKDRNRLIKLGYFIDVGAPSVTVIKSRKRQVDIKINIKEKKVNRLDFGLETEKNELLGFTKLTHNHLGLHSDLLFGKIQIGRTDDVFKIKSYSARYMQPYMLNLFPFSFTVDIWDEIRRERLSSQATSIHSNRRWGGDIVFTLPLLDRAVEVISKYKSEKVILLDNTLAETGQTYTIRSLSGGLKASTIESRHNPKNGWYSHLNVEKGGEIKGIELGGIDFLRYSMNIAGFLSLLEGTTLATRGFYGVFQQTDSETQTFETEGFELGGANSLRGYRELHELNNRQILINFELRQQLTPGFQGVLFCDIGKSYDGSRPSLSALNQGVGFGGRFFTPLGPIRLDFAWPKEDRFNLSALMLHFSLGQLF